MSQQIALLPCRTKIFSLNQPLLLMRSRGEPMCQSGYGPNAKNAKTEQKRLFLATSENLKGSSSLQLPKLNK